MAATPAEVVGTALQLAGSGDWDGFVARFHDDAVYEFPFAPPGRPSRLDGRDEIHAYMTQFPSRIEFLGVLEMTMHETKDPEVVVLEMRIEGRLKATGEVQERAYVNVVRVRDEQIVHYRDYWNPLQAAE